jgi:hypothetical protein
MESLIWIGVNILSIFTVMNNYSKGSLKLMTAQICQKREQINCKHTRQTDVLWSRMNQLFNFYLQWYNQKQIKQVISLSLFVLGNLSIYLQFSNVKRERDGIKHSWQITCDDQIMLTHIAEASFITVSIYCMRAHLFHYRKFVYKTDRLNCIKRNKNDFFVSLNMAKQPAFTRMIILSTSLHKHINIIMCFKKSLTYFGVQVLCSPERFCLVCGCQHSFCLFRHTKNPTRCVTRIKYS